ncbi:Bro-N domain-containing protein [uncultured Pseudacidovorax sp.]|uniref:BRO-N domain-containing protein n=1 Tax=uncultured Pseudacidovorax sp. TaxID=679313 RepID=UPI0025F6B5E8|nr:Bro-N domain-containing protein [uncultured Pseudacidovorax sp.]
MSNIVPYTFEGRSITVITDEAGEPWFIAKEVADVLGYSEASAMTRYLDEDEKGLSDWQTPGGRQRVITVNESGLYSAILRSERPEAKPFKRWVTHDVLPSIRKTGGYATPNAASPLKATAEAARALPSLIRAARLLGCDRNAAAISANQAIYQMTNINLMQQLGQTHLEAERQDGQWYTPTELGKLIGTSARGMNLLLAEAGLQAKIGEKWEPTEAGHDFARIYDTGKRHNSGVPVTQLKWSPTVLPMLGQSKEVA